MIQASADEAVYLTLKQLSLRTGLSVHTLRHWVQSGRLNQGNGLRSAGSKWLVEWAVFKAALDKGEF